MELRIEDDGDRLLVYSPERDHTVLNLVKQAVWDIGGKAGYDKGHPYTGEATLVVNADNPQDILAQAIDRVRDDLQTFQDAFNNA